jgi:putative N6-adenine-specific DNA methylase
VQRASPSSRRSRHQAFAVCTPGLDDVTAHELRTLGIANARTTPGGVEFSATNRQLYLANVWLRTATRVIVRIGSFTARHFDDLERRVTEIEWGRWLVPDLPVRLRVSSSSSRLYHTGAIADRFLRVIPNPPAPDDQSAGDREAAAADQLLVVRVHRDRVSVSVDSSGAPLHRRGWRTDVGKAPLRETLAAAMLLAAGWDGTRPLVDPFCGSGTIPIEAALIAAGMAPGGQRSFAFQRWPGFEPGAWASVRATIQPERAAVTGVAIVGRDRDAGAVERALANAERAGVTTLVEIRRATISDLAAPPGGPGWMITNPPYGARLSGGDDLRNLYARLGARCRQELAGWSVGVLAADRRLAGHTGLTFEERLRSSNGGLPVRYLTGLVEGSPAVAS